MNAYVHIIDNKKVRMTNDEWEYYNTICKSYNRPNFKGEELFKNLFESDDDGIITFLKPPCTSYTSIEVFLFVVTIYQQQHMRIMYDQLRGLMVEVREEIKKFNLNPPEPPPPPEDKPLNKPKKKPPYIVFNKPQK